MLYYIFLGVSTLYSLFKSEPFLVQLGMLNDFLNQFRLVTTDIAVKVLDKLSMGGARLFFKLLTWLGGVLGNSGFIRQML